jgi:hypothetical protein
LFNFYELSSTTPIKMALTSYYAFIGGNNYYDYYIFINSIILFYF